MARHLAYTLALDYPANALGHLHMAKFLVLSLLRTRFDGDIVVFRNTEEPLFMLPRKGVREVVVDAPGSDQELFWHYAQSWKFKAGLSLDVEGYDKVLYLDADCLALHDVDPLLEGDWELGFCPEPGRVAGDEGFNCFIGADETDALRQTAVNGGLLAVSARCFHEVMRDWQRIHEGPACRPKYFTDQASLNRLLIDSSRVKRAFSTEEVATPFSHDPWPQHYFKARLVHLAGSTDLYEKLRFMFGLYMNTYFFDQRLTLFNLFET